MTKTLPTLALILGCSVLPAQQKPRPPYASDKPLSEPAIFGKDIISTGDSESHPAFTPDGTTLYFLKNSPAFNFWTICESHFADAKWSAARVAPFSGQYSDADPFITADGSKFFFISNRPIENGELPKKDLDIWMMTREGARWSVPVNLGFPVNSKGNEWYPTVAADGTLYFGSDREGGFGQTDIYRSKLVNGKHATPENLGPPISTAADEYEPFVAPDQDFLIFMAERPDGKGRGDLYVAYFRDGKWTGPLSLGGKINTTAAEYSPKISPDGRYFFWSSARPTIKTAQEKPLSFPELTNLIRSPGNGLIDIYHVDLATLGLQGNPKSQVANPKEAPHPKAPN